MGLLNNLLMVLLINLRATRSRKACGQHLLKLQIYSYVVDAGPCCLEDSERLRAGRNAGHAAWRTNEGLEGRKHPGIERQQHDQ